MTSFEQLFKQLGKGTCSCPKPVAFANDMQRVEALVCGLPTSKFVPSTAMNTKELLQVAKRRKLVDETSGLEKSELRRLVSAYDDCAICLETMQDGALIKTLDCGHFFHMKCVYEMAVQNAADATRTQPVKCPLCRADIRKQKC